MKIISRFKDCYDHISHVFGVDEKIVYVRDVNPDLKYGSSVACKEAIGYIRGTCMMTPVVKPHSFCSQ